MSKILAVAAAVAIVYVEMSNNTSKSKGETQAHALGGLLLMRCCCLEEIGGCGSLPRVDVVGLEGGGSASACGVCVMW